MWLASWPVLAVEKFPELAYAETGSGFTPTDSVASRRDREIIGGPARAGQRRVPPLLRIVHKTLLRHGRNQQVTPSALVRCDRSRPGVGLEVGAVIAGTHVDACFGCAGARVSGAIGIGPVGIELR